MPRPGDSDLPRVAYLGPKSPVPRPSPGRGPLQLPLPVHSPAGAQAWVGGGSLGPATAGPCARSLLSPPGCSRPGRCSRARALVPGRGRTYSPRRRVVGRPCPEGAKRLGGAGRVYAPRFFLALVPAGLNPGPPQAPAHARRSRLGRVFLARHSPGGGERRDSAQSLLPGPFLWYLEPKAVPNSTLGTDRRVKTAPAGIPTRTPYIS